MSQHTPMQLKAARASCKRHAEVCNVNEQDLWNIHSEEFIDSVKAALDAVGASGLLSALKDFVLNTEEPPERNCSCHISPPCNDCVDNSCLRETFENARAAIAKAEVESA